MFRYSPESDAVYVNLHEFAVALRFWIRGHPFDTQTALLGELLNPQECDAAGAADVGRQHLAVKLPKLLVGLSLPGHGCARRGIVAAGGVQRRTGRFRLQLFTGDLLRQRIDDDRVERHVDQQRDGHWHDQRALFGENAAERSQRLPPPR